MAFLQGRIFGWTLECQQEETKSGREDERTKDLESPRPKTPRILRPKLVNDRDVSFDLDRLAVENRWAVAPLAHGVGSRAQEERIALDHLQGLDRPVGGDDGA